MDELQQYAENVGLYFEESGLPRMAGRILAWLLVCEPPHQTQHQLAEHLRASMGSISTMTRLLTQLDLVERLSLPGERRDYFQVRDGAWEALFRKKWSTVGVFCRLIEEGLALTEDQPPEHRRRLQELHEMYAFFEAELPLLLEKWESISQTRVATAVNEL